MWKYLILLVSSLTTVLSRPVYLALPQHNIPVLRRLLDDISNPTSVNYGKWMSPKQINLLVSPPVEHQTQVLEWVSAYNVDSVKNYGDSIVFSAERPVLNQMFNLTGEQEESLTGYTIPEHLRHAIEFVEMFTRQIPHNTKINVTRLDNKTDDRYFGREPLLHMYNVSDINLQGNVSGCLVEYQNNSGYTDNDVYKSQTANSQSENRVEVIVGSNYAFDDESELDVQLMSQAADGIRLWYWNSPYWLYSFAVDFYNTEDVPDVVSMSWGWAEDSQCSIIDCRNISSQQYVERVNNEYLKISLRGTTLLAASGDAGAPGRTNEGCDSERPINPVFPGSSPYVLSIGGTAVNVDGSQMNYTSPICQNNSCITSSHEFSISFDKVGWTAGGGFDLYGNQTPTWQQEAVTGYLESGVTLPDSSNFNKYGRAYPDLSAIGHSCPTYINGMLGGVDGTSCSTPVVAGLIAIINHQMWEKHQTRLGFANPMFYYLHRHCPDCFQDIVDGYNWCTEQTCCHNKTDYGFQATKGYDPVTGLGTLNIGRILSFLQDF